MEVGPNHSRLNVTFTADQLSLLKNLTSQRSVVQRRKPVRQLQQRKPRPTYRAKDIVNQSKQDTETVAAVNNVIPTSQVSIALTQIGSIIQGTYLIHPGNHLLFPNLQNIYKSYQQYYFKSLQVNARAIASSLQSGAYLISASPQTIETQNGVLFTTLANYATTEISSIWRDMKYRTARNILNRLKSYLVSSTQDANSCLGTLYLSQDQTSQSNANPAPFPICEIVGNIHMKDFIPAKVYNQDQLGLYGVYYDATGTSSAQVFQAGKYVAQGIDHPSPSFNGSAANPTYWFTMPRPGRFQIFITATYGAGVIWKPSSLKVGTINEIPIINSYGHLGCYVVYDIQVLQPNVQISSTSALGWITVTADQPITLSMSIYQVNKNHGLDNLLQRQYHYDKVHQPKNVAQSMIGSINKQNITLDQVKRQHFKKQPTIKIQLQSKVGYCWVDWLRAANCSIDQEWDSYLTISLGLNEITVENVAMLPVMTFLRIIKALQLNTLLLTRGQLSHTSNLQCHIVYAAQDIVANTIYFEILNYQVIGVKSQNSITNASTINWVNPRDFKPSKPVRISQNSAFSVTGFTPITWSTPKKTKKLIKTRKQIIRSYNRKPQFCHNGQIYWLGATCPTYEQYYQQSDQQIKDIQQFWDRKKQIFLARRIAKLPSLIPQNVEKYVLAHIQKKKVQRIAKEKESTDQFFRKAVQEKASRDQILLELQRSGIEQNPGPPHQTPNAQQPKKLSTNSAVKKVISIMMKAIFEEEEEGAPQKKKPPDKNPNS